MRTKTMSNPIVELVTYRVHDVATANAARAAALPRIQAMPGFLSYEPLVAVADPTHRADVVTWASMDAAKAAAKSVMSDPNLAPFMASIAEVSSMAHFARQWPTGPVVTAGLGIEVSFFRLKPGVSEADARAAHRAAVDGHIAHQDGWLGEWMITYGGGLYGDLLLARDQPTAEAICRTWHGNASCEAFVALVEDVDMSFGTIG
jgi:hypothetical protein